MRLTKFVLILLALALLTLPISCMKATGPETDVIIKITARRIAFHGLQAQPDVFKPLGILARESCQILTEQAQPADVAFSIIVKAIATKTSDPLLAQDIQDIIELIGIKLDLSYKLLGLDPVKLKFITLFVCSFAQGIEAVE